MYFNDLKIETAVHQYFLLAEKKDFFTAESNSLEFFDALSMRSDYYYNVTAVDCAGLESTPGKAIQMK